MHLKINLVSCPFQLRVWNNNNHSLLRSMLSTSCCSYPDGFYWQYLYINCHDASLRHSRGLVLSGLILHENVQKLQQAFDFASMVLNNNVDTSKKKKFLYNVGRNRTDLSDNYKMGSASKCLLSCLVLKSKRSSKCNKVDLTVACSYGSNHWRRCVAETKRSEAWLLLLNE